MTDKAWKALGFSIMCGFAVWIGTASAEAAGSEAFFTSGSSVAGMGAVMDRYYRSVKESGNQAVHAALTQDKMKYGNLQTMFTTLGVAMVDNSLNIRKEPKNNSEVIGKMSSHAGCSVLASDHGWYKIKSGPVTGYVYGRYLAVGQAARAVAYYDMRLMLRVDTNTLRARTGPDTKAQILGRIHEGETYDLLFVSPDGWAKIRYQDAFAYAFVPDNATIAYTIPEAEKVEDSLRQKVVKYAVQFVGNSYQWGGTDPNTGADCSGFVQYVMSHAAGVRLERTSRAQAGEGQAVSTSQMEPGDLLFYSSGGTVNHVAMYIGDGQIVHAANRKSGIKISSWNYRQPVTIRRVIP